MPDQEKTPSKNSVACDIPPRLWLIASVIGAGAFLAMMDSTVINLAVGQIDLKFPLRSDAMPIDDRVGSSGLWSELFPELSPGTLTVSSYLLAMAVSLPLTGWLGNRFGNARLWVITLVTFLGGSIMCAVAPDAVVLIAGRIVQGLSAGIMIPAGQALLGRMAGPRQLGRIMGSVGFAVALGPALGPAIGGWLVETFSWRWIFWLNMPVGALALVGSFLLSANEPKQVDYNAHFDARGYLLLAAGLLLALTGAIIVQEPNHMALAAGMIAVGTVTLVCFFKRTPSCGGCLVDPSLMEVACFRAGFFASGLTAMNMYGGLLFLSVFFETQTGLGLSQIGGLLFFMGIGAALALPVCGMLCDRFGAGAVFLSGSGLLLINTVALMFSENGSFIMLAILLALRGAGLALTQMPAVTGAYVSVDNGRMGDAATLINLVQRAGACIGVAVIATLAAWGGLPDMLSGLVFLLLLAVAMTLPALQMMRAENRVGSVRL